MIKFYLAGCISYYIENNHLEKASNWRSDLSNTFITFNPCTQIQKTMLFENNDKGIVYQNICYLKQCNVIVVNLDDLNKSPGTIFELNYCLLNNKPVVAFGDDILYYKSPHIKESITIKLNNLNDVIKYLKTMYYY